MRSLQHLFKRSRHIVVYAGFLSAMIFLLKWLQWKYLIADYSMEIYVGVVALAFTTLGLWIATQLTRTRVKTVIVEKEVYLTAPGSINETELGKLNLSNREYEVLKLIARGHRNAEIAEHLFLSLSTVKTHVSNLFVKMEVKNRTQAIEKANRLKIIP